MSNWIKFWSVVIGLVLSAAVSAAVFVKYKKEITAAFTDEELRERTMPPIIIYLKYTYFVLLLVLPISIHVLLWMMWFSSG